MPEPPLHDETSHLHVPAVRVAIRPRHRAKGSVTRSHLCRGCVGREDPHAPEQDLAAFARTD
jgi:hypothetical protein